MGFFSALQDMFRKKQDDGMPYSIVMLLRSPFAMSEEVLSRAASKAYRVPYDGFSLLQVFDSQTGGLVSPQSASQEKSQQGTVTFAFHPCLVRALPQRTGLLPPERFESSLRLRWQKQMVRPCRPRHHRARRVMFRPLRVPMEMRG